MHEIDLDMFAAAHADGAVVIDVREPHEYVTGHVSGTRLIPLAQLPAHADDLPRRHPIYLICASGNRSLAAANFLAGRGLTAYSVAGGMSGWQASGRPVVYGARASVA
jgi:rhodanese-related sulfurtransferase